jgi:hypothetical protein
MFSDKLGMIQNKGQMVLMNLPLMAERSELFIILSIGEVIAAGLALPSGEEGGGEEAGGSEGCGTPTVSPAAAHQADLGADDDGTVHEIGKRPTPSDLHNPNCFTP